MNEDEIIDKIGQEDYDLLLNLSRRQPPLCVIYQHLWWQCGDDWLLVM